ncbi:hypothetical protein KFE25_012627 [Diacronema lutheri]|uniref:Transcription elongation factor Eaf N-terminal domain-containing protein n=1 Tax=Diacronema lutheri TaxID=2081491 RepID=A0A8J5WZG9_DIALT|nr:hypothetical protein KFE25_012627 [Diacronema lutheri]
MDARPSVRAGVYEVTVGDSLRKRTRGEADEPAFHTARFKFKPASVPWENGGELELHGNGDARYIIYADDGADDARGRVNGARAPSAAAARFAGAYASHRPTECVLVQEGGSFRLERLTRVMSLHAAGGGAATAPRATPARAPAAPARGGACGAPVAVAAPPVVARELVQAMPLHVQPMRIVQAVPLTLAPAPAPAAAVASGGAAGARGRGRGSGRPRGRPRGSGRGSRGASAAPPDAAAGCVAAGCVAAGCVAAGCVVAREAVAEPDAPDARRGPVALLVDDALDTRLHAAGGGTGGGGDGDGDGGGDGGDGDGDGDAWCGGSLGAAVAGASHVRSAWAAVAAEARPQVRATLNSGAALGGRGGPNALAWAAALAGPGRIAAGRPGAQPAHRSSNSTSSSDESVL